MLSGSSLCYLGAKGITGTRRCDGDVTGKYYEDGGGLVAYVAPIRLLVAVFSLPVAFHFAVISSHK